MYPLWNNAIGQWLSQVILIKSTAQPSTGWRGTAIGTPDWSRMSTVEIHADTWDFGFTMWFDRVGFNLPSSSFGVSLAAANLANEKFDAFWNMGQNSAATPPPTGTAQRDTFDESIARRAAIEALLTPPRFEIGVRSDVPAVVNRHDDMADGDSDFEDIDAAFAGLVSSLSA